MSVDGGSRYFEDVCDLLHGFLSGVVQVLGDCDLVGVEFGSSSACASACSSCGESVAGVGDDEFSLQFGEDGEHPEHGAAFDAAGVDALFYDAQPYAAFAKFCSEVDQVHDGSAEAIEACNGEGVAVAEFADQFVQFGSAGFCSAGVIEVDVRRGDACAGERVGLVVGVLDCGGDAGVAEEHCHQALASERLRLDLIEFSLGDGAGVQQLMGIRNLAHRGAAALIDELLGVLKLRLLSFSCSGLIPLRHSWTAGNDVHQHRDQREEQQKDQPQRLNEAVHVVIAEDVKDNIEQHHEVNDHEEDNDQRVEELAEFHMRLNVSNVDNGPVAPPHCASTVDRGVTLAAV